MAVQLLARAAVGFQEHRCAQRPGLAEKRSERGAQLLGSERLVLEERKLPAVECLRELGVAVGPPERSEHVDRNRHAEGVQA